MNLSNPANLLIFGVYLVLVGGLGIFSLFGVYTLVRYGRSTPLVFTIAIVYAFFFLKILAESYQTLSTLLT